MAKKKKGRKKDNKLKPWYDCKFDLKLELEEREFYDTICVFLERRAKGKYGKLSIADFYMSNTDVGHNEKGSDLFDRLFSLDFRHKTYKEMMEKMTSVGVPEELQKNYLSEVSNYCPIPTQKELFDEELENPLIKLVMGDDIKKLSYFKTRKPEWSKQDQKFVQDKIDSFQNADEDKQMQLLKLLGFKPPAR